MSNQKKKTKDKPKPESEIVLTKAQFCTMVKDIVQRFQVALANMELKQKILNVDQAFPDILNPYWDALQKSKTYIPADRRSAKEPATSNSTHATTPQEAMKILELLPQEYAVARVIHQQPEDVDGWRIAFRQEWADKLGIWRDTFDKLILNLVQKGAIEEGQTPHLLRPTKKWLEAVKDVYKDEGDKGSSQK